MKNNLLLLLFCLSACSNDIAGVKCAGKEYLQTIKSATGTVHLKGSSYVILRAHENSFDSVDVGFVCAMPDSLKKEGLEIKFEGEYYTYDGSDKPTFAGTTHYYLALTAVSLK